MSKGGEQILARDVSKWLGKQPGVWYVKIHGGPYQRAGIWDFLVCVRGRMLAIELKNPNGSNDLSPLQRLEGRHMEAAGAQILVARSFEEVVLFVERAAREASKR